MSKIAYLGPSASFTHQAALDYFGDDEQYIPQKSIAAVFDALDNGETDYAVVPVENSTEGIVTVTFDLCSEKDVFIQAEKYLQIHQNFLLAKETETVTEIYSHPQALAQCRMWLEKNYPGVQTIETSSTSKAAQKAVETGQAAIAGRLAAEQYGLNMANEKIEDMKGNTTRFLILSQEMTIASDATKTSLMFALQDKVGALYDALLPFKEHEINLSMIQSRPSKIAQWEYIFFVDFLGSAECPNIKQAMDQLEKNCKVFKIMGSYKTYL